MVADCRQYRLLAAGPGGDHFALTHGFRIAPEFCRPDHPPRSIKRHHAVLLTGDPDGPNLGRADRGGREQFGEHLSAGLDPGVGMLFPAAPRILHEAVPLVAHGQDVAAAGAEHHPLGTLCTAVYAYVELIRHCCAPLPGQIELLIKFFGYSCLPLQLSDSPWALTKSSHSSRMVEPVSAAAPIP